jgi:hypothetical protein
MKRLLGIALAVATLGGAGLSSEAKASEASPKAVVAANESPQWQRDRRRVYNRRRMRSVNARSRIARYGRRLYRETYLVRYLPNGRTDTRLITRVRIT